MYFDPETMKRMLLCILIGVMVLLQPHQIRCCLPQERAALTEIKSVFPSKTDNPYGQSTNPLPSWPTGDSKSDCCTWEQVKCSPSTGHVTHLALTEIFIMEQWDVNMTLFCQFPELMVLELSQVSVRNFIQPQGDCMLKNLRELNLSSNFEMVKFPDWVWNFTSLRVLDLTYCNILEGKLDERVCQLRNLGELYLRQNDLNGSIPDCVWNLTSLRVVDLSDNSFSGKLPSMNNLHSLEYLSIIGNNFEGKFYSSYLENLSSLKVLMLSNNAFQVEIEESQILSTKQLQFLGLANCNMSAHPKTLQRFLSFQSNLAFVDLSGNGLVGKFPTWLLHNNSNLKILNLQDNSLSGFGDLRHKNMSLVILDISRNDFSENIPSDIGMTLSELGLLNMSDNSFQGGIPSSLGNMTQLSVLDLSRNKLTGVVPRELFCFCSQLDILALSDNHLEGDIIPNNMNLSWLSTLKLDGNHFGGMIKDSLKISVGSLMYLDLSNNIATGELPSWIGNMTYLNTLSLRRNKFHGSIPRQICHDFVEQLDLSENKFTGHIPFSGCSFSSLLVLHLQGNKLTGEIPKWGIEGNFSTTLQILDLANNQLSGGIPTWFDMHGILNVLLLEGNKLQGELPIQLCKLTQLNILDLSNNNISGSIPSCFRNLSFGTSLSNFFRRFDGMTIPDSLSTINFKDHKVFDDYNRGGTVLVLGEVSFVVKNTYLPYTGSILPNMSSLDLSCNQLDGVIPIELGELAMIHALNLSHNSLTGSIPKSFSKLRSIESLDLSNNKLSGEIPHGLVDMNFLETFNVSYNNISGEVPETGQFGSFGESSYQGNPLLCGLQLPKHCRIITELPSTPTTQEKDEQDTRFDMEVFLWSFGASSITVLLAMFLVLFINAEWRRAWFAFIDWHMLWWLY